MSGAAMGALVRYCGHRGVFAADIHVVGSVNVVRANGAVTGDNLDRSPDSYDAATHHIVDFPIAGFWQPRMGVFVVPKNQVRKLPGGRRA